jgi:hypothetical protein
VVDAYLVEELFKNKDDGWDSFYLYFDASVEGEKLHFGPIWDFDLTGGNTDNGADLYQGLWAGVSEGGTDNPWYYCLAPYALAPDMQRDDNTTNCANFHHRPLYGGNFPNCAATVEDGSWCERNDACYNEAVIYDGRTDCAKAWK